MLHPSGILLEFILPIMYDVGMIQMLDNRWLTLAEAAEVTGFTDSYLRFLLRKGEISGNKFSPRLWLIDKKEAEKLAKKPKTMGRPRKGKKS